MYMSIKKCYQYKPSYIVCYSFSKLCQLAKFKNSNIVKWMNLNAVRNFNYFKYICNLIILNIKIRHVLKLKNFNIKQTS